MAIQADTRARKRRARTKPGIRQQLRSPMVGRVIFWAMIGLTVLHVGYTVNEVRLARFLYGPLMIGLNRQEVRYFVGDPIAPPGTDPAVRRAAADATPIWQYRSATALTSVAFDTDSGRVATIVCSDAALDAYACPTTLGLGVGTGEDTIWYRLGVPDRQTYSGDAKTIYYDDLRLNFTLRQFRVTAVRIDAGPSSKAWLARMPRLLVP